MRLKLGNSYYQEQYFKYFYHYSYQENEKQNNLTASAFPFTSFPCRVCWPQMLMDKKPQINIEPRRSNILATCLIFRDPFARWNYIFYNRRSIKYPFIYFYTWIVALNWNDGNWLAYNGHVTLSIRTRITF